MLDVLTESHTMRLRRMDGAHQQLIDVMRRRELTTLFQPLVDPRTRSVFGHEALSRGPSDSWLHAPQNLFATAHHAELQLDLELLCAQLAALRFIERQLVGRLFVNVSPDSIYQEPNFAQRFLQLLHKAALPPERCVIELTEDGLLDDYAGLRTCMQQLREHGIEFAIDDLGTGSSGLRIWSELRPDYVKIDRYFVSNIDNDAAKAGFVRSIIDLGRSIGCQVIAEGVETAGECRELIELGIDRLQGYLFGRPEAMPLANLEHLEISDQTTTLTALCAEHMAVSVPPLDPHMRVADVAELFRTQVSREMLVVADGGKVMGAVRRQQLFALLSKPLHLEVFSRKPISAVMDTRTLTVDARLRLEQVSRLVIHNSISRLTDEFVITRDGQYLGIGQTMDLLRIITEQQVQSARHSNPLTLLPGNGPIRDCIKRLLGDHRQFVMCYVDVDHFKPYNDVYGYAQGDEVILHLAEVLKKAVSPRLDFLGHVGGDDFVLIMRSPDWQERIQQALAQFSFGLARLYSMEHFAAGCMPAADRDGAPMHFPLLSLSVAALRDDTAGCTSPEAAAQMLVDVKKAAKRRAGNSFMLRSNAGICDLSIEAAPTA